METFSDSFVMTMTSRPLLWSLVGLVSLVTGVTSQAIPGAQDGDCPADLVTFEVITGEYFTFYTFMGGLFSLIFYLSGFVYTAPADMLDSQPGTLILNDCIETCRQNSSCKSINFETGLCVLFSSSADDNKSMPLLLFLSGIN